jgi:hypothetical protein
MTTPTTFAFAAALAKNREAIDAAVIVKRSVDGIFNLLVPGYSPPKAAEERFQRRALELVTGFLAETLPIGSIEADRVNAMLRAAMAYAMAAALEPTTRGLETELLKLVAEQSQPRGERS